MDVIKYAIIGILISVFNGYGQNLNSDTSTVSLSSQTILSQQIDLKWHGGTLAELIKQLHQKYGFKFSHAGQQINFDHIKPNTISQAPLGNVLSTLLKDSKFDYIVVGRMIVIVKRKQAAKEPLPSPQKVGQIAPAVSDENTKSHVYTSRINLEGLSWYERRVIYKTFQRELSWAQRRSNTSKASKDSLTEHPSHVPQKYTHYQYFVNGSLGVQKSLFNYKDGKFLNWEEEIDFNHSSKVSILADLTFGYVSKYLMLGTGLGLKRISTRSSWTEIRGRRPLTFVDKSVTENYTVWSIPIQAQLYKSKGKLYGAAGIALKVNFIKLSEEHPNKFERYYDDNTSDRDYFQKAHKVALSTAFIVTVGFKFNERMLLTGSGEYEPYLTTLESNALYKLYPHQLSFKLGFTYLFDMD